jgi:hypothetical protein
MFLRDFINILQNFHSLFGLLLLLDASKQIERFCTKWIQMTLCLLRSRLRLELGRWRALLSTRFIDSPVQRPGDVCQMRRKWMGSFILHRYNHPFCTLIRAVPTHHRTLDAPRWRSRLALDVGEGQKLTRCIDSPVRRRGGV